MLIVFVSLIVYYHAFVTSNCFAPLPYRDNPSYLKDLLILLRPTEKKTYTLCPEHVVHSSMEGFNAVTLTESEINRTKIKWQKFVSTIPAYPLNMYSGRGIVSSASSGFNRCRRLIASIKLLRWLKCRLPVEVFMYPSELQDQEIREFQNISDVKVRVLTRNITLASVTHSPYAIKLGAIVQSSFEHVL